MASWGPKYRLMPRFEMRTVTTLRRKRDGVCAIISGHPGSPHSVIQPGNQPPFGRRSDTSVMWITPIDGGFGGLRVRTILLDRRYKYRRYHRTSITSIGLIQPPRDLLRRAFSGLRLRKFKPRARLIFNDRIMNDHVGCVPLYIIHCIHCAGHQRSPGQRRPAD